MRWDDCPASWKPLTAEGLPAASVVPAPGPMSVIVHDDGTAAVIFKTSDDEVVIMTGAREEDELFHLHADSPNFQGDFLADIDPEWSYASGIFDVRSRFGGAHWRAQIDVYLWAGRRS